MKRILTLFILIVILFAIVVNGQGTQIRNLPSASSVNSGDMFPGDAFGGGTYKYTFSQLLGARTITCMPPLLCNGSTTMDLAADRTLAIGGLSAPITPAAGGGTFFVKSGSSQVSATNEGLRPAMFSLFGQSATATQDNALMTIDSIQTDNSSTMRWTGLQVKTYTHVDNGGDISGILCTSSGGGNCLTVVKASGLRPAGFANLYNETGPAAEFQSADWGPAAYFISGSGIGGNPQKNSAIIVGLGQPTGANQSGGVVIQPNDGVFDSRYALVVGTASGGAEPVNQKFSLFMSGDVKVANSTNDGSVRSWTFLKSRSGASINTNESLGDFNWNGINSTSVEKPFGLFRVVAADKTSGSEDGDFVFYSTLNGSALAERGRLASTGNWTVTGALGGSNFSGTSSGTNTGDQTITLTGDVTGAGTGSFAATLASSWKGWTDAGATVNTTTSTDKVGIGTSSPDALLVTSANVSTAPAATAGTLGRFVQVDGTNARLEVLAFNAVPNLDLTSSTGTAASQAATAGGNIIGQITYRGFGTSTVASAKITAEAEATFTGSSAPTKVVIYTAPSGSTTAVANFVVDNAGHMSCGNGAPTVACTGTGTSPTAPSIDTGGTDCKFTITINTGTGSPSSAGTCTITFAKAYVTNKPVMVCMPVDGASAWSNEAVVRLSTQSLTAPVITWTNEATGVLTGLTASTSYKISCIALQ